MTFIDSFDTFGTQLRAFIVRSIEHPGAADDSEFDRLACALFALQYEAVPIFQRLCAARSLSPASIRHWSEIPAMPTSAFKDQEISSLPPMGRTHVFFSSGTTGQVPSRHFHDNTSLAIYEASLLPWFTSHFLSAHQADDKMDCLFLTPAPSAVPHSSLVHMFETVRGRFEKSHFTGKVEADGSWTLDLESTMTSLQKAILENKPIALLGTAFSFVHLLDSCQPANQRLKLPSGSRVFETGGYKGRSRSLAKDDLHKLISKFLGVPQSHILSEYGMSELSSQAYDGVMETQPNAPHPRVFQFPPWARTQIICPETGESVSEGGTGLLKIVDLANTRSVLALQTEDLAVRRGNGFELLGRSAQAEPRGCSLMPG